MTPARVAFRGKPEQYPNLEIKKIPKAVLAKYQWGHDD
jgi:adenine-specific DNA-methyltransferase